MDLSINPKIDIIQKITILQKLEYVKILPVT